MKHIARYIDLVFCLIVLPGIFLLSPIERWAHHFTTYTVMAGIWLYALYFINRRIAIPLLFVNKRERVKGIAIILLTVLVTAVFSGIKLYTPKPVVFDDGFSQYLPRVAQYRQVLWTSFMIVEAFSFAVSTLIYSTGQIARLKEAEFQKEKAEIELYKAQIKPHFMFNTLNSIYGLFLTRNENALPSLEKFISMMRYVHLSSNKDFVSLGDETEYIRQYVDIQSLRLNKMTSVYLHIDVRNENLRIPPMLLVTFVENCFKHGISSVEPSTIRISLTEDEGTLLFSTSNLIFPIKRIGEHMGIDNCRKRLNLLYEGRYRLSIFNNNDIFKVSLQINLKS